MKFILLLSLTFFSLTSFSQSPLKKLTNEIDSTSSREKRMLLISQGLKLTNQEKSDSIKAEFYLISGITYGMSGKADTSLLYFNKSISIAGDKYFLLTSRSYNGIGLVNLQLTGDRDAALESFQKALTILEDRKDAKSMDLKSTIYKNVSGIYYVLNDFKKALFYTNKSLNYALSVNDSVQLAYSYLQLGLIYNKKEQYQLAQDNHLLASKIIEKVGDVYLRDYNNVNLAKVYENSNQLRKAVAIYDKQLAGNTLDIEVEAFCLQSSASIYLLLEEYQKAIKSADGLLKISSETGLLPNAIESHFIKSEAYQALGKYKVANEFLNKYIILNDSLKSKEKLEKISELESKYDKKEKEKEIISLKLENQQANNERNIFILVSILVALGILFLFFLLRSKSKLNAITSKSLAEKETLLKEIHHRVKNNLQVISSLLSLQSRFIKDPNAKEAVNEGQSRVKSMALIHQELYQHDNLSGVEAMSYIKNLTSSLKSAYGIKSDKVNVQYEVENLLIDADTIIPMGLILNELITNVFKYAFPDDRTGELVITLKEEKENLKLSVKDDGVGAKVDIEKLNSFGIRMINSLANKLEASVNFNFDNGTEVTLDITNFRLIS